MMAILPVKVRADHRQILATHRPDIVAVRPFDRSTNSAVQIQIACGRPFETLSQTGDIHARGNSCNCMHMSGNNRDFDEQSVLA